MGRSVVTSPHTVTCSPCRLPTDHMFKNLRLCRHSFEIACADLFINPILCVVHGRLCEKQATDGLPLNTYDKVERGDYGAIEYTPCTADEAPHNQLLQYRDPLMFL